MHLGNTVRLLVRIVLNIKGACLAIASNPALLFSALFSWLPAAHDGGMVTYHGVPAHRWAYSVPSAGFGVELLFSLENNLPVAMTQNYTDPSTKQPASVSIAFYNFTAGKLPGWEATWTRMQRACASPARCPKPSKPFKPAAALNKAATSTQLQNVSMYIFHPPNSFDIAGQDLGDPHGDTLFVCQDILGGHPNSTDHNYQWLTQWTVELVPWWGQYQNCNGYGAANHCLSKETFLVGRETPEYLQQPNHTALQRQCGPTDPLLGQWFSLPVKGECKPGTAPNDSPPADGGCSWRKVERVKTIDGNACLVDGRGFAALCKADARAPFPKATAVFLKAFASEDAHKGGCPALTPPRI